MLRILPLCWGFVVHSDRRSGVLRWGIVVVEVATAVVDVVLPGDFAAGRDSDAAVVAVAQSVPVSGHRPVSVAVGTAVAEGD